MYNLIGTVYRGPIGTIAHALNDSVWKPLTYVSADSIYNIGMLSNNDGSIINNSGDTVELNGRVKLHTYNGVGVVDIVVGVSSDGITWIPEPESHKDDFTLLQYYVSGIYEYKVDVPHGSRVALLAKSRVGNNTVYIYTAHHHVYSTQGQVVPKLNVQASTQFNGVYNTNTVGYQISPLPCVQGSQGVGGYQSNGRIVNNSGETLIVDGTMHLVCQGSLWEIFTIFYGWRAYKNAVFITESSWAYSISRVWDIQSLQFTVEYTVEIAHGQYVDLYDQNYAGGIFGLGYRSFQHTMRSRT
jgi:hypothetical protein